jgi:hypothetical protein
LIPKPEDVSEKDWNDLLMLTRGLRLASHQRHGWWRDVTFESENGVTVGNIKCHRVIYSVPCKLENYFGC